MDDLTDRQKHLVSTSIWMVYVGGLCFCLLQCFILYLGKNSPTSANTLSGEIYPFYDKSFHNNYVYITETENKTIAVLFVSAGICIVSAIVISAALEQSVKSSQRGKKPGQGDKNTSDRE
jgi:ABC-type glycerol-3-phosphate transport system permease component